MMKIQGLDHDFDLVRIEEARNQVLGSPIIILFVNRVFSDIVEQIQSLATST